MQKNQNIKTKTPFAANKAAKCFSRALSLYAHMKRERGCVYMCPNAFMPKRDSIISMQTVDYNSISASRQTHQTSTMPQMRHEFSKPVFAAILRSNKG